MNEDAATPTDFLRFCPECGKPTVNFEQLADTANCYSCMWKGTIADLLHQPVDATEASTLMIMAKQDFVKNVAGALTHALSQWLMKWGFVVINKHLHGDLLVYVKNGSNALYESLLTTRETLAKDQNRG